MKENIIFVILILVILIFTINSLFLERKEKNYVLIFNVWWMVWLTISYMNVGEYYSRDFKTYILIFGGIFFFNLSLYLPFFKLKIFAPNFNAKKIKNFLLLEKLFFLMNLFYLVKMFLIIGSFDNYWKVRFIFYGLELNGEVQNFFYNSLEAHFYYILKMINFFNFLIALVLAQKNEKKLLKLSITNLLMFCMITGGREFVSNIIILGIFSFKAKILKNNLKLILLLIIFVLGMTILREGGLSKIILSVISYYTGSIAFFDYLLKNNNDIYYNGELLLSPLIMPIRYLLNFFSNNVDSSAYDKIGGELKTFVQLSDTNSFFKFYNALPTAFYWQFKDFGILGILVINFILGITYRIFYKKIKSCNINHLALISYFEYLLIQTIFNFKHIDIYTLGPAVMYIYILEQKKLNNRIKL